ncbi:hypothetical protein GKR41_00395 [Candidatus Vallotia lariciata]|nr:hypothetical protein GKR41_00395 [Candidatus Vallotia lariciata]
MIVSNPAFPWGVIRCLKGFSEILYFTRRGVQYFIGQIEICDLISKFDERLRKE